ncbi:MAG: sigma 54-interacting transcriptional regulator [Nitrospirae bacterium]|nr:sigma 54-interacting transcriptional regulator [Nitrospirota bacterium]
MDSKEIYKSFLREHYPFNLIPDQIVDDLISCIKEEQYGTGQTIYQKGEEGGIFNIVHTGEVYELITDRNGEEIIVSLLREGSCFGAISVLTGEPHSVTTRAKGDVELYVIERGDLEALLSRHPSLNKYLTRILTEKIRNLFLFFETEGIRVFEKAGSIDEKEREISFLNRITNLIGSKEDYEKLLDTIVSEVRGYTGADVCSVYLLDPITSELILEAADGVGEGMVRKIKMDLSQGITGWVIRNSEPVAVYDVHKDPRVHIISDIQEDRLKSLLSLPLVIRGKCIGALNLANVNYRDYSYNDIQSMGIIANHIAMAISNFRLRKRIFAATGVSSSKLGGLDHFVGETSYVRGINRFIDLNAKDDGHALLKGEEGTGKNLLASLIHRRSRRAKGPFITVDCESFRKESWGEELFGDDRDPSSGEIAFGFLELAHGGTILLRNIESLNQANQIAIYKFLNDGRFVRVHGHDTIYSNTRVIATVNGDTKADDRVDLNKDLYDLLSANSFSMVPLRKMRKDIPVLSTHLLKNIDDELHKGIMEISGNAMERLLSYDWPGNVLELENVLRRAVILANEGTILSNQIFFGIPRVEKRWEFNLFSMEPIKRFFYTTRLQKGVQITAIILMFYIIYTLILHNGTGYSLSNIILWSFGWFGLFVSAFSIGRIWCTVCPFSSFGDLLKRIKKKKIPIPNDVGKKSERYLVGLILLVLFAEGITVMPAVPLFTGLLILFILIGAIVSSILYDKRVWCRYICPLGGLLGIYSLASFVTIKANRKLCLSQCTTHDCYLGRDEMEGCPMLLHPYGVENSQNCTLCGSCVRTCRHNSLRLSLHLPTTGVEDIDIFSLPFSFLASALAGILLVENGSMLSRTSPLFTYINNIIRINPNSLYALLFIGAMTLPFLLIISLDLLINRWSKEGIKEYLTNLPYSFMPLALLGHIALYGKELVLYLPKIGNIAMERIGLRILFSPIGVKGQTWVEILQVLLVIFGAAESIYLLLRIYKKSEHKNLPKRRTLPIYIGMILFFAVIYVISFLGMPSGN